jgi:hypothetical protein
MRRFPSLQTLRAEHILCAISRPSPHFGLVPIVPDRRMSTFGGLGDIQIETILPREGGEEIFVGGFSYARFSSKCDTRSQSRMSEMCQNADVHLSSI